MDEKPPVTWEDGDVSKDAKTTAMLAHLLAAFVSFFSVSVFGFAGPLVIYMMKKDKDEFVAFHSLQALYLAVLAVPLGILTCGVFWIVAIVFHVVAAMEANNGEWYEYPVVGKWAK